MFKGKYGFFDYKVFIPDYHGEDLFSPAHFITMGIVLALIITAVIVFRKTKHSTIDKIVKVFAILAPVLEIAKISWETYYDITLGRGINWGGLMPFYTCSMFLYVMPFVAFGKGKVKQFALSFFTGIGIIAGLTNFVYLSALSSFPLFTLGAFYSIYYHAALVFFGLFFMTTGYYRPHFIDILYGLVPVLIFSALVLPINYIIYYNTNDKWVDYMLLMHSNGTWIFGDIADFLEERGLMWLNALFVLVVGYGTASAVIVSIEQGVYKLTSLFKKKPEENSEVIGDTQC